MDTVLSKLRAAGRLEGYPIQYNKVQITPHCFFTVFDERNITIAKVCLKLVNDVKRYPWEYKGNYLCVESLINFSGYKGMGADLLRLVIAEAKRLAFPIVLWASPGKPANQAPHKLYKLYDDLGFQRVGSIEKAGTFAEYQEYKMEI